MNREELVEIISSEIHKCYCRVYERRFGKPYWTNGDYSKLDELTKDYDREMAEFIIQDRRRIVEPLIRELKECNELGLRISYAQEAIKETLKLAGIEYSPFVNDDKPNSGEE